MQQEDVSSVGRGDDTLSITWQKNPLTFGQRIGHAFVSYVNLGVGEICEVRDPNARSIPVTCSLPLSGEFTESTLLRVIHRPP